MFTWPIVNIKHLYLFCWIYTIPVKLFFRIEYFSFTDLKTTFIYVEY